VAEAGADPAEVRRRLEESDARLTLEDLVDWRGASLSELIEHIVLAHHAHVRKELPRIARTLETLLRVDRGRHPGLKDVRRAVSTLDKDLAAHLQVEEQAFFPGCVRLESVGITAGITGEWLKQLLCHWMGRSKEAHARVIRDLTSLRRATHGYTPPPDASPEYRALLHDLAALEKDLFRYLHKEANLLCPRLEDVLLHESPARAEVVGMASP
jgi:regulator of cell morphogenesis and NO signaling